MYVGGWESAPGFPQEHLYLSAHVPGPPMPVGLQLWSLVSIQHPLLVLRAWNLTGLVLSLVVPPSFISLGCSGSCTGQVSRPEPLVPAHPTPYGLALAEAGARPLPQDCWGSSVELAANSRDFPSWLSFPSLPSHFPLSACASLQHIPQCL